MFIAPVVDAGERGMTVTIASSHTLDREYNEFNPGLGYVHYLDDNNAWEAGFYYNSSSKWSTYAGYRKYFYEVDSFNTFVSYGGVTGYESDLLPYVALGVEFELHKNDKLNIIVAPITGDVDGNKEYGVVFGLRYERVWRNR